MQARKILPEEYRAKTTLDLAQNRPLAVGLSVVGLILFFLFAVAFTVFAALLRYDSEGGELAFSVGRENLLPVVGWSLLVIGLTVLLHEVVHALFIRLFTGEWATFGFKGIYAYAAAPAWYIPRNLHIAVALAPLVLLSLLGILFIPWITYELLPALLLGLITNAAGAVGDMVTVGWLLRQPRTAYVNDYGDGFTVFTTQ